MSSTPATSLYTALLAAQRDFSAVVKNKQNPHLKNFYADLGAILDAVTEPLAAHGLLIVQRFGHDQGGPILITEIVHAASEQKVASELPIVCKDPTDPQKLGGAITYARRYSLLAILSLTAEDDDGNSASQPAPRKQQPQPAPTPRPASQAAPAANGSAPASEGVEAVLTHARILANDGMDVAGVWKHLIAQQSSLSDEDWKVVLAAWKGIKQGILDRMKKPAGYAG